MEALLGKSTDCCTLPLHRSELLPRPTALLVGAKFRVGGLKLSLKYSLEANSFEVKLEIGKTQQVALFQIYLSPPATQKKTCSCMSIHLYFIIQVYELKLKVCLQRGAKIHRALWRSTIPEGMQTHLAELANMSDDLIYLMMVSFWKAKIDYKQQFQSTAAFLRNLFISLWTTDMTHLKCNTPSTLVFQGTCHPCSGRAPRSLSLEVKRSSVASYGFWMVRSFKHLFLWYEYTWPAGHHSMV